MGCRFLEAEPTGEQTYSEVFREQFPLYLAIGMSSTEYWEGDASLTRYYRRAFQLKQEMQDQQAWLNGLYTYEAFSVVMANTFGDKKATYPTQPHMARLAENEKEKQEANKVIEAKAQAKVWMEQLVKSYGKRGGE